MGEKTVICIISILLMLLTGCMHKQNVDTDQSIKGIRMWKKIAEAQSVQLNNDILNIEVSDEYFLTVQINSSSAYEKFLSQIENYRNCFSLYMDLMGTDTEIYLDELLALDNFQLVTIVNGGSITLKDKEMAGINSLSDLVLNHINRIDDDALENFMNESGCENLFIRYDNFVNDEIWLKEVCCLNQETFRYTSYIFCEGPLIDAAELQTKIVVESREDSEGGNYDVLEIPAADMPEMTWMDGQRIKIVDVNFDGYEDIIFLGYNDGLKIYHDCVGFLWEPTEKRFVLNDTLPSHFSGFVDYERKRLTYATGSGAYENYYIYKYKNGRFAEQELAVTYGEEKIMWEYYEDGICVETLEAEDMNQGEQHFPEFDFYIRG